MRDVPCRVRVLKQDDGLYYWDIVTMTGELVCACAAGKPTWEEADRTARDEWALFVGGPPTDQPAVA